MATLNTALWTTQRQTEMYRMFEVLFGAAPGTTYMDQLYDLVISGKSTLEIYSIFIANPQFTSVYPTFLSNKDFATKIIEDVIETSATPTAKAFAASDMEAALAVGWSRDKAVYQIFTNIANKSTSDVDWGLAAKQLANKVEVSKYYTETLNQPSTDFAVLRKVISGVTHQTNVSTPAAIAAIIDTALNATYTVSANQSTINEGSTATFTVTTTKVTSGTSLAYTLSGVSASDITGGSLSGTATVGSNGQATISVPIAADQTTEGNETLTVTIQGKTASTTIIDTSKTPVVPTYSVSSSQLLINEGSTATFTVTTTNVASGTSVYYILLGISASDITGGSLSGMTTVGSNGQAKIYVPIAADQTTEGNEKLTVQVFENTATVTIIDTSIGNTSLTGTLKLVSASPANNTQNVALNTQFSYTFDSQIAFGESGGVRLWRSIGIGYGGQAVLVYEAVAGDAGLKIYDQTLRFQVPIALAEGEWYRLEIDKDIVRGINGTSLQSALSFDYNSTGPAVSDRHLSITPQASFVMEGGSAKFDVVARDVLEDSELSYTISGISLSDLESKARSFFGTVFLKADGAGLASGVISIPIAEDDVAEPSGDQLKLSIDGQGFARSASIAVLDKPVVQPNSYSINSNSPTVSEGSSATFLLSTTNLAAGSSVAYTLSGINAADIVGGALSGNAVIASNGQATITVPIAADQLTEGTETLTVTVQGKTASTQILDTSLTPAGTYAISAKSASVNEGANAEFTVVTTNVSAGTELTYNLSGISSSDVFGGALSGSTTVASNGQATITIPITADAATEGDETLTVTVQGKSASTVIKDTSLSPPATYQVSPLAAAVDEGGIASFSVETTNVTAGTSLSYTLSGVTASDLVEGSLTGTTVVGANSKASISVPIAADLITEGSETLTLTLQGKSASVTINDTSITPTVTDFRDVTALQDSSGHFLFTGNATEAEIMQQFGWKQATGLKAFETVDHPAGVTLHKFYYPPTNSFYYATDDQAKAVKAAFTGWVYQGATDMKVFTEAQLKSGVAPKESVPIYQMWVNGTGHVYTTDTKLVDTLMGQDINTDLLSANNVATSKGTYNGVVFWGDPVGNNTSGSLSSTTSSSTEYRFVTALQDKEGHFLFTANQTEADIMQQFGWSVAAGVKGFESADTATGVTLHKFYYPPTNSFYYATDDQAKAVKASFTGWDYQGATDLKVYTNTSYAVGKAPTGSVPIYQMWVNGKGHVYTTDTVLVDQLMGQDINTNVLTANNVATANGTYNGVVFWGDPARAGDTTPPSVTSILLSGVDSNNVAKSGALTVGNRVKVVLTMSEAVAVTGIPSIAIDVGGSTKSALYAGGSGSSALTFYYMVEAGDQDKEGGITTLFNGLVLPAEASIKDSAGNNATLSIASVASGTNTISVDTIAPTVQSYSPTPGATNVAVGANFIFTFSETIKKGTGTIKLLDAKGTVVESFNVLTSSRLTWASNTLTIDPSSDLSINQLYRFEIPAGAIDDEAGNDYAGTSTYTITTVGEAGPPPGF